MAFCKYCGTKLEDGKTCTCAAAVAAAKTVAEKASAVETTVADTPATEITEETPVAETSVAENTAEAPAEETAVAEAPVAKTPATTGTAVQPATTITLPKINVDKEMVQGVLNQYISIMKAPATGSAEFINGKNTISAAIIIAIQALLSGIIACFYIGAVNKTLKAAGGGFINLEKYKFSGFKGLLLSIILSVLFAAIFAGIMFCIAKILKLSMDIKEALEVTAVRASYLIPVTVLAILLSIVNIQTSILVYVTGSIFALGFVLAAMMKKYPEKSDLLVYLVTVAVFVFVIVMALIMSKACNLYVPGSLKKDMGDLSSIMNYIL